MEISMRSIKERVERMPFLLYIANRSTPPPPGIMSVTRGHAVLPAHGLRPHDSCFLCKARSTLRPSAFSGQLIASPW